MNINGIKGKYLISLKRKNFKIMAKIPNNKRKYNNKKKKFNGNISPNMLKSNMSPYPINLDANR